MGWKDLSFMKKGFLIGLIIGILLNIFLLAGIFACNWNPAEGSVVPDGICRSSLYVLGIPLYPLILFSFIVAIAIINVTSESMFYFGIIISAIISTLIIAGVASFFGWVIGKIKSSKK